LGVLVLFFSLSVLCGGGHGAPDFFPVKGFLIDFGAGEVFSILSAAGVSDPVFSFGVSVLRFSFGGVLEFVPVKGFLIDFGAVDGVILLPFRFSVLFSGVMFFGCSGIVLIFLAAG
jgi:hypothetical protein